MSNFFYMYVFTLCVHLVPVEARGEHCIPWNWSIDVCEFPCGFWEPNMGSLEEQLEILNSEPSLHPKATHFLCEKKTLLFNILKLYYIMLVFLQSRSHDSQFKLYLQNTVYSMFLYKWAFKVKCAHILNAFTFFMCMIVLSICMYVAYQFHAWYP